MSSIEFNQPQRFDSIPRDWYNRNMSIFKSFSQSIVSQYNTRLMSINGDALHKMNFSFKTLRQVRKLRNYLEYLDRVQLQDASVHAFIDTRKITLDVLVQNNYAFTLHFGGTLYDNEVGTVSIRSDYPQSTLRLGFQANSFQRIEIFGMDYKIREILINSLSAILVEENLIYNHAMDELDGTLVYMYNEGSQFNAIMNNRQVGRFLQVYSETGDIWGSFLDGQPQNRSKLIRNFADNAIIRVQSEILRMQNQVSDSWFSN